MMIPIIMAKRTRCAQCHDPDNIFFLINFIILAAKPMTIDFDIEKFAIFIVISSFLERHVLKITGLYITVITDIAYITKVTLRFAILLNMNICSATIGCSKQQYIGTHRKCKIYPADYFQQQEGDGANNSDILEAGHYFG